MEDRSSTEKDYPCASGVLGDIVFCLDLDLEELCNLLQKKNPGEKGVKAIIWAARFRIGDTRRRTEVANNLRLLADIMEKGQGSMNLDPSSKRIAQIIIDVFKDLFLVS